MVGWKKIVQKSFNREMDSYLSDRVKPLELDSSTKKKKSQDEKAEVHKEKIPFYQRIIRYFHTDKKGEIVEEEIDVGVKDEEIAEVEEMDKDFEDFEEEVVIKTKRKGVIERIFSFILPGIEDDIREEEFETVASSEQFELPDDLKEALKIQNKWLKKLDPEIISEFKSSEDYDNYKIILQKYGLIK